MMTQTCDKPVPSRAGLSSPHPHNKYIYIYKDKDKNCLY